MRELASILIVMLQLPEEDREVYRDLEALLSPKQNFKAYRETIKNRKPPIYPYLGTDPLGSRSAVHSAHYEQLYTCET
jgi:hypothetical protein